MGHDFQATGEEAYIAIDPGLSTGYATFRENGDLIRTGTARTPDKIELYSFLQALGECKKLKMMIIEDYLLYPWKAMAQSWDRLHTVRYIGAFELWCYHHNIQVDFQSPNVKGIGYRWAGLKVPKNHDMSHETDAFVHGVYYLQHRGIRRPQQGAS